MVKNRIVVVAVVLSAVFTAGFLANRAIAAGVPDTDTQCVRIDYPTTTPELTFGHLADPNIHITRYLMACVEVSGLPIPTKPIQPAPTTTTTPGFILCPMGAGIGDGCPTETIPPAVCPTRGAAPAAATAVTPEPSPTLDPQTPALPTRAATPQAAMAETATAAGGGCLGVKPIGCDCTTNPVCTLLPLASGGAAPETTIPDCLPGGLG